MERVLWDSNSNWTKALAKDRSFSMHSDFGFVSDFDLCISDFQHARNMHTRFAGGH